MTSLIERLKAYRRRKHPDGRTNRVTAPRLTDGEAAALSYLTLQTGADASAIARITLTDGLLAALRELDVSPSIFGLGESNEDAG